MKDEWRDALSGLIDEELLKNGTPKEIISRITEECQRIDMRWRHEIMKYLPQMGIMSFCGPVSTIKWLMNRVDIKNIS